MKLCNACEISITASLPQVYDNFISMFLLYQLTVLISLLLNYVKKKNDDQN